MRWGFWNAVRQKMHENPVHRARQAVQNVSLFPVLSTVLLEIDLNIFVCFCTYILYHLWWITIFNQFPHQPISSLTVPAATARILRKALQTQYSFKSVASFGSILLIFFCTSAAETGNRLKEYWVCWAFPRILAVAAGTVSELIGWSGNWLKIVIHHKW